MNPNDYYIHSFKQIGAQIDQINKFYQSPIADFAKRQQALYENMGSIVRQHYSNYATDVLTSTQQVLSMCGQTALAAGLQTTDNTLHTLINSYPKICGVDFSELFRVSAVAAAQNTISPISNSLAFQNAAQIGAQLVCGIEPLTSALNAIRITPAYVEIPAELIPDDFDNTEEITSTVQRPDIIKVSPKVARYIIDKILLPILVGCASTLLANFITTHINQPHQEETAICVNLNQQNETVNQPSEITTPQSQEQLELQKKQYEACLRGIDILEAIYNQLDSDSENQSISDHISPEVDSLLQQADSLPHYDESPAPDDHLDDLPAESHPRPVDTQLSTTQDSPAENTQSSKSE